MRYPFRTCLEWRKWVVPELLRERPVHRWLVFPHSFTDDIVRALAEEWNLGKGDQILDPFAGAGTTVLAAKQLGIAAIGFDLSPLAALATQVKTANYDADALAGDWKKLHRRIKVRDANGEATTYAELVRKALPDKKLATFHGAKAAIEDFDAPAATRAFFKLALLAQIPKFSNAVPTGGWLSWRANRRSAARLPDELSATVRSMLADLRAVPRPAKGTWRGRVADARRLPVDDGSCAAVITSPPYPNPAVPACACIRPRPARVRPHASQCPKYLYPSYVFADVRNLRVGRQDLRTSGTAAKARGSGQHSADPGRSMLPASAPRSVRSCRATRRPTGSIGSIRVDDVGVG